MRRITLLSICVLILTALSLTPSTYAAAYSGPTNIQFQISCSGFTASADTIDGFGFFVYHSNPNVNAGTIVPGAGHLTISDSFGVTLPEGTVLFYIYGDLHNPTGGGSIACSGTPVVFADGRLDQYNAGQTTALYCSSNGFTFWAVDKGTGYIAFSMTRAQLAKYPAKSTNYLIKQAKGVRLYRLSSGELQVVRAMEDGTDYHYIFHDTDCGA